MIWLLVSILLGSAMSNPTDISSFIPPIQAILPLYSSNVTFHTGVSTEMADSSILQRWYKWEKLYMNAVQPVDLDVEFITNVYNHSAEIMKNTTLLLETLNAPQLRGILVMLVIGILYVVLIPVIGLIWCTCQCCCPNNHQTYDKNGYKKARCCLSFFTLIFVLLIWSSAVLSYLAGADVMKGAAGLSPVFDDGFADMGELVDDTENRVVFVAKDGYASVSQQMKEQLTKVGSQVGSVILSNLQDTGVTQGLLDMITVAEMTPNIAAAITEIQNQAAALVAESAACVAQFDPLSTSLVTCFPIPPYGCPAASLVGQAASMKTSTSQYNLALNLNAQQTSLAAAFGLSDGASAGYRNLRNIPNTIFTKSASTRESINELLDKFGVDIDDYLIPVNDMIQPVWNLLNNQSENLGNSTATMRDVASYGHTILIAVASIILIIGFMMFAGCGLGAIFFKKEILPTQRRCFVTCGNFCLMISVYLILLLAWIFLLVTMVGFIVGTQMEEILCPMLAGAPGNFTMMDSLSEFISSTMPNSSFLALYGNQSLAPGTLMLNCQNNMSLFKALNMESIFDFRSIQSRLDGFNIRGAMNGLQVNLQDVDLFSSSTEVALTNFLAALEFPEFSAYLTVLDPVQSPFPINQLNTLKAAIQAVPNDPDYVTANMNIIQTISAYFTDMDSKRAALTLSIQQLTLMALSAKNLALQVEKHAISARAYMTGIGSSGNVTADVATAASLFATNTYGLAEQFVQHLTNTIEHDVGECRPVFDAVENMALTFCDNFLSPLNGFWFALGVSLIVFIPSLCCNCKLAKYYRRANSTDSQARRLTFTENIRRRRMSSLFANENSVKRMRIVRPSVVGVDAGQP